MPRIWTPQQKPPAGSQIDFSHPLAQGIMTCVLANENAGSRCTDIANNKLVHSIALYKNTSKGLFTQGVQSDLASEIVPGYTLVSGLKPPSMSVIFEAMIGPIEGSNSYFFTQKVSDNSYSNTLISHQNATSVIQVVWCNLNNALATSSSIASWETFSIAVTYNNPAGILSIYKNGKLDNSVSDVRTAVRSLPCRIASLAQKAGGLSDPYTKFCYSAARCWTATEVAWLYQEPYAMILPAGPRRFYSIPGMVGRGYLIHSQRVVAHA